MCARWLRPLFACARAARCAALSQRWLSATCRWESESRSGVNRRPVFRGERASWLRPDAAAAAPCGGSYAIGSQCAAHKAGAGPNAMRRSRFHDLLNALLTWKDGHSGSVSSSADLRATASAAARVRSRCDLGASVRRALSAVVTPPADGGAGVERANVAPSLHAESCGRHASWLRPGAREQASRGVLQPYMSCVLPAAVIVPPCAHSAWSSRRRRRVPVRPPLSHLLRRSSYGRPMRPLSRRLCSLGRDWVERRVRGSR